MPSVIEGDGHIYIFDEGKVHVFSETVTELPCIPYDFDASNVGTLKDTGGLSISNGETVGSWVDRKMGTVTWQCAAASTSENTPTYNSVNKSLVFGTTDQYLYAPTSVASVIKPENSTWYFVVDCLLDYSQAQTFVSRGVQGLAGSMDISLNNQRHVWSNSSTTDNDYDIRTSEALPFGPVVITVVNRTASTGLYGKIYYNGVDVTSSSTPTDLLVGTEDASVNLCLGGLTRTADLANNGPLWNRGFSGQMFQVVVYNNAEHTAEQVLSNANILRAKWNF
jgi:hypothetical protein